MVVSTGNKPTSFSLSWAVECMNNRTEWAVNGGFRGQPHIWTVYTQNLEQLFSSVSLLEFLLHSPANYYYLKFCPLIIQRKLFFFQTEFTVSLRTNWAPLSLKLMSWEITVIFLSSTYWTSVQRLPALIGFSGPSGVVVFYTFASQPSEFIVVIM